MKTLEKHQGKYLLRTTTCAIPCPFQQARGPWALPSCSCASSREHCSSAGFPPTCSTAKTDSLCSPKQGYIFWMTKTVRQSALLPQIDPFLKINKITFKKFKYKSPHTTYCLHFNQEQKENGSRYYLARFKGKGQSFSIAGSISQHEYVPKD